MKNRKQFYIGLLTTIALIIGSYFSLIILTLAFIWLIGIILGLTYQLVLLEKKVQLYSIFEAALQEIKEMNKDNSETK